ncbi:SH3-like domain-containing protein [Caballeronia sordidicola]|uniref:SH3-like domain-containing protein n=1 Tax=Caballeronia sordidicola TaxID=196367 RepID=UPI000A38975D
MTCSHNIPESGTPAPTTTVNVSRRLLLLTGSICSAVLATGFGQFANAVTTGKGGRPIVDRDGWPAKFKPGDDVRVSVRYPIGHYRVPTYIRGKRARIVRVIEQYINPEEEGYGRDAGHVIWMYQISLLQSDLWVAYKGAAHDHLQIEVFEPWLEHI